MRILTDALVLFEVLSEETARTDRLDKLDEYALLPSVRSYILVEQDRVGALVHTREAGRWIVHAVTEGAVALPELGIELPLSAIYVGVTV